MPKFFDDAYTRKAMELVRQGKSFFTTGKADTGKKATRKFEADQPHDDLPDRKVLDDKDNNNKHVSSEQEFNIYCDELRSELIRQRCHETTLGKFAKAVEAVRRIHFEKYHNLRYMHLSANGKILEKCDLQASGEIIIPDGVEVIGNGAFQQNTHITSVQMSNSVREIKIFAFEGCTSLESVTFSQSLISIAPFAFSNTKLLSVDLPESLIKIDTFAFSFTNISEIEIPANVTELGDCIIWEAINVNPNNSSFTSINGCVFSKNLKTFVHCPRSFKSSAELPEAFKEIEVIRCSAFNGVHITDIDLPESLKEIEAYAFSSSHLNRITIPGSVKVLSHRLFDRAKSLHEITFESENPEEIEIDSEIFLDFNKKECVLTVPEKAYVRYHSMPVFEGFKPTDTSNDYKYYIDDGIYYSVDGTIIMLSEPFVLGEITINENVVEIKEDAFKNRALIDSVDTSTRLVTIGNSAFRGCTNLKEVHLYHSLEAIGTDAFTDTALESITVPSSVTSIGLTAFQCEVKVEDNNKYYTSIDGVLFSKDGTKMCFYPRNRVDDEYTIPDGTEIIDELCFDKSTLTTIKIPKSVKQLMSNAFYGCENLDDVYIPAGIEIMKDKLFDGCSGLVNLSFLSKNPESIDIDENVFAGFDKDNCTLRVPYGCKRKYESMSIFEDFNDIEELDEE